MFARHNLISDPPFSRMDLISCRNVMIYLEASLQKKLIPTFHYGLRPGGHLFLGASESIGKFTERFEPMDKKHKFFSKKSAHTMRSQLPIQIEQGKRQPVHSPHTVLPAQHRPGGAIEAYSGELNAEREADRVTVNQFAPPGVLINAEMQILQFRGHTGAFLEPPTGKASFDLLKMVREGLMLPLRATIKRAMKENRNTRLEHAPVTLNGKTRSVSVEVVPLKNLKERRYLVLFADTASLGSSLPPNQLAASPLPPLSKKAESSRIGELELDLAETRDYLQSIQEYQEAANEELQASNEEGQSSNEELQSLNEELETSKEELESTNEELTTVNEEMVNQNAELNRLYGDLKNLQTSANLAIVLLGRDLAIRRFTPLAEKQFHLLSSDLGRSMSAVRHDLQLPDLEGMIREVIDSGQESEHEVQARDGRWYSLRVSPYFTLDNKIDGAVIVLVDIDALKNTERLITAAHEHATAIIHTVPNPLVILDANLCLQSANESFYRTFNLTAEETKNRSIFELGNDSWNIPRLRHLLEEILPKKCSFNDFEVTHNFQEAGLRTLILNARMVVEPGSKSTEILLGLHDITERKNSEIALTAIQAKLTRYASDLELMVNQRTLELTETNKQLVTAVDSIGKSREETRKHLLESQEMQKKLRLVTHKILTAQEDERKRVSRELHDEVVQTLIAINVELSVLVHGDAFVAVKTKKKISQAQKLVERSVEAVHRFARDLRPAVLDDLGLLPAIQAYCRELIKHKKIQIKLKATKQAEALSSDSRTVLFRVAQEALSNISKHACATKVTVEITKIAEKIQMKITDNGKAFSVQKILNKSSNRLGLVGMKERLEMVGGRLTIESSPSNGTQVRAEIPFTSDQPNP